MNDGVPEYYVAQSYILKNEMQVKVRLKKRKKE